MGNTTTEPSQKIAEADRAHTDAALLDRIAELESENRFLKFEVSKSAAAVAAIMFAVETDDVEQFLHHWIHGDWDVIRREWPACPEEAYIDVTSMVEAPVASLPTPDSSCEGAGAVNHVPVTNIEGAR